MMEHTTLYKLTRGIQGKNGCHLFLVDNSTGKLKMSLRSLLYFSDRIEMNVDATPVETPRDLPPDVPTPLPLENLYIAGIPSSVAIPLQVPVLTSFNGDIKHVQVNGETLFDGR